MTEEEAQLRLCGIMQKLSPMRDGVYVPSERGIIDDLDFLDLLVSHTLLDLEAKVREARAQNGK